MQFLQCCLKFSIIVFFAVCVHVNHRRCNFAVSFECYDTEFIELMPHTWNLISLCEHTNEHFIQHESLSVVHILTVGLRCHELHLLYILAEEKNYFEFDSFLQFYRNFLNVCKILAGTVKLWLVEKISIFAFIINTFCIWFTLDTRVHFKVICQVIIIILLWPGYAQVTIVKPSPTCFTLYLQYLLDQ